MVGGRRIAPGLPTVRSLSPRGQRRSGRSNVTAGSVAACFEPCAARPDPLSPDRRPAAAGPHAPRARPEAPGCPASTDLGVRLPALPGLIADRAARAAVAAPATLEIGLVALPPPMGAEDVNDRPDRIGGSIQDEARRGLDPSLDGAFEADGGGGRRALRTLHRLPQARRGTMILHGVLQDRDRCEGYPHGRCASVYIGTDRMIPL